MTRKELRDVLAMLKIGLIDLYGDRLRDLRLFGSYARGEERPDSDLDVLIVLDSVDNVRAEIEGTGELVSSLSLSYDVSISRTFVGERDWLERATPFLQNVRRESIVA